MFTLGSRACLTALVLMCMGCQVTVPTWLPPAVEQIASGEKPAPSAAYMLLQDDKLAEAERLLRRSIERHPSSIVDRTNLAILLAQTSRTDESTSELDIVLARRPEFCPALVQRAQIQLTQYDIDAAEQSYRTCLNASPDNTAALLNLGILLELYRGEFDQALHYYEQYQQVLAEPNRQVANWITDLSRRLVARSRTSELQQFAEVTP